MIVANLPQRNGFAMALLILVVASMSCSRRSDPMIALHRSFSDLSARPMEGRLSATCIVSAPLPARRSS
jgi:hypothetical protein